MKQLSPLGINESVSDMTHIKVLISPDCSCKWENGGCVYIKNDIFEPKMPFSLHKYWYAPSHDQNKMPLQNRSSYLSYFELIRAQFGHSLSKLVPYVYHAMHKFFFLPGEKTRPTYQTKDDVIVSRFYSHSEWWNLVVKAAVILSRITIPL